MASLYVIPIAIADNATNTIPDQVKEAIMNTRYFLVENVRTARRFISQLKLGITIEDLHFEVLDKKTPDAVLTGLMQPLTEGHSVGVMSESGCPGIADPGARAVYWAHQNNFSVVPLTGPSSITMALMASGFNGQKFAFHGYLPIDKKKLAAEIRSLEKESSSKNQTQVFIETPYRNNQLFKSLLQNCHDTTMISLSRDVTGKGEFIKTRTVADWKSVQVPDLHKVPTVFSIYAR